MIIKSGVIGHFLFFLESKLKFRVEYSIAGFHVLKHDVGERRTLYISLCPHDVAVNIKGRMFQMSILDFQKA